MEITRKKLAGITATSVLIAIIAWTAILYIYAPTVFLNWEWKPQGRTTIGQTFEIHMTIWFYKNGELLYKFDHPGAVTNLGDNMSIFKLIGSTSYQYGSIPYSANATFISIGNQGSLSTSSVILPGEWNRTTAAIEVIGQSQFNLTATFYPDAGPYTADCIGINLQSSGSNLWGYDTFTEVTGIDDTFTINVEFSVTVSHA